MIRAPRSFAGLTILAVGLGFGGGLMWRGQEVSNYETLIKIKDGQIDAYQKTINERLDKVEKTLSDQQLSSLQNSLRLSPSEVAIIKGKGEGEVSPYATQLEKAFSNSGWIVEKFAAIDESGGVILRAKDLLSADTIKQALETANVKYHSVNEDGKTDFLVGTWGGSTSGPFQSITP